jgi:cobalt/nickel transport system ATP-binding protein
VLLDAGRLCADGPAREVLSNAEWMDKHGLEVPPSLRK